MTVDELENVSSEKWLEIFGEDALILFIQENNKKRFLILKIIEECNELAVELTKSLTKSEANKPPMWKIRNEAIDIMFRLLTGAKYVGIEGDQGQQKIKERLDEKIIESVETILEKKREEPVDENSFMT